MSTKIRITEKASGQSIALIPLVKGGLNYSPTEQERIDEAWDTAVEDGLVQKDEKGKYNFTMILK